MKVPSLAHVQVEGRLAAAACGTALGAVDLLPLRLIPLLLIPLRLMLLLLLLLLLSVSALPAVEVEEGGTPGVGSGLSVGFAALQWE
jgi:hypothetical protein